MPTQTIDNLTINYRDEGRGPAVVLVHGFPLDGRIWDAQVAALKDRHRVIVPDLPGFGQSKPPTPFTIESAADAVHALLEKIDALPYVLAGLSMGGYIAFACVMKCPTTLKGLVLVDTRVEADTPEGKAGRQKMIDACRQGGSKVVADQMLPKMLAADTQQSRPQVVQQLRSIMESCPPQTIEYALIAMRDRNDYRDKLASIAVPTLIIVGEADAITPPSMSEFMNREIPHSKLVQIKGAGHMTPMEQPEQVNRAMKEFLGGLG